MLVIFYLTRLIRRDVEGTINKTWASVLHLVQCSGHVALHALSHTCLKINMQVRVLEESERKKQRSCKQLLSNNQGLLQIKMGSF